MLGVNTSSNSLSPSRYEHLDLHLRHIIDVELEDLFAENVAAKIWRVAQSHLENEVRLRPLRFLDWILT
jgi:hypothetical protein